MKLHLNDALIAEILRSPYNVLTKEELAKYTTKELTEALEYLNTGVMR